MKKKQKQTAEVIFPNVVSVPFWINYENDPVYRLTIEELKQSNYDNMQTNSKINNERFMKWRKFVAMEIHRQNIQNLLDRMICKSCKQYIHEIILNNPYRYQSCYNDNCFVIAMTYKDYVEQFKKSIKMQRKQRFVNTIYELQTMIFERLDPIPIGFCSITCYDINFLNNV